ncbi:multidrug effflux MFS transporter [Natronosporangium hydrolyticum]|uniref:Multidrug effflux MFS transporter n=1 Tax=Natronosporangium hydrolyticum TaxID=2811111 RepID=A0A895YQC4_9ACTN|nr:multidrug effflux MFS transporter [Natronosporangium hydrolyticum]QSB16188.1 multidrug effflux MFS transporter [Natronosporangium hydrolyticum]
MSATLAADPISPPGDELSGSRRLRLILVLGSLVAIGPLTIDMYLPALPALTEELQTTNTAAKMTLTGTLLGLGLGQLVIGPLSDSLGRRGPLLAGLVVHVLASALCVFAPTIGALSLFRVLQGLGVAAAAVVAMAVLRDLFSGAAFARLLSRLLLVMGAAPILAPTLGGAVLRWTDWRGVFVVLAGFGVLLIAVAFYGLPESLPPARRQPASLRTTLRSCRTVLRDRTFVGLVLVAGLAMAALFAYVAGSPFVFQEEYGLSEQQFAVAFGAGAVGLIAATQLNAWLLRRYSPQRLLATALVAGSVAGLVLVGFAATGVGGLVGTMVPLWLVLAAAGLALPNAPALAMSRHGEAAGTAAAVLGAVQFGVGGLAAPVVGLVAPGSEGLAMAVVIAGGMLAATLLLAFLIRRGIPDLPPGDGHPVVVGH